MVFLRQQGWWNMHHLMKHYTQLWLIFDSCKAKFLRNIVSSVCCHKAFLLYWVYLCSMQSKWQSISTLATPWDKGLNFITRVVSKINNQRFFLHFSILSGIQFSEFMASRSSNKNNTKYNKWDMKQTHSNRAYYPIFQAKTRQQEIGKNCWKLLCKWDLQVNFQ